MPNNNTPRKEYECNYELDVQDIEYLMCHVMMLWRRVVNSQIKSLGINATEKRVLVCISRNPGLTQTQIANILELEPQNLIRSLDKLEKQNWIKKCADTNDRRTKLLFTTEEAKPILNQIKKINASVKPQILFSINEKEIKELIHHLTNIRENLFKELDKIK